MRVAQTAISWTLVTLGLLVVRLVMLWRRARNRLTYDNKSTIMNYVVRNVKRLSHYRPPFFLWGGISQTVSEALVPAPELPYRREALHLTAMDRPVGMTCCPAVVPAGTVSIDWLNNLTNRRGLVLLIPGLTGSSNSKFIRRAAQVCQAAGFGVCAYSPRGRNHSLIVPPIRTLMLTSTEP